ncbi:CG17264 [Drosophila busckii]|uniref:CG17264 n=1 Tax=Drosophila busckii TaxID=30019 RepID=A0A0M4E915_DROBS|nr:uncharacterized protein LOC108607625 [Drosophila busckii]ALC38601.1 CG17264 [Drosophila busckii]
MDMDTLAIKMLKSNSSSNNNSNQIVTKKKVIVAADADAGASSAGSWFAAGSGQLPLTCLIYTLWLSAQLCKAAPPAAATNETAWPAMRHYDIWSTDLQATAAEQLLDEQQYADELAEDAQPMQEQLLDEHSYRAKLAQSISNLTSSHRAAKVIHLFPVPVDGECLSDDGRRLGNCFNAYECRQKGGQAKGECAMGFGVCCVFVASCNATISNNITYIVSPEFPSFMPSNLTGCQLKIKLMGEDISQLRIDFYHFSLGQPNRRTGVCDGDVFTISGGPSGAFSLCGQNSGQHLYYDVGARARPRQSSTLYGSLRPTVPANQSSSSEQEQLIEINLNLSARFLPIRLWELRVAQIPFSQRAPAGCLQYHTGLEGVMQTFNFADNGRHLANQHYRVCVRQESDMCSIMYQPCDEQSFRIGGGGAGGGAFLTSSSNSPGAVANNPTSGASLSSSTAGSLSNRISSTTTAPSRVSTTSSAGINAASSTATSSETTASVTPIPVRSSTASSEPATEASVAPSAAPSSSPAPAATAPPTQSPAPSASPSPSTTTAAAAPANDDVEGSGGEQDDSVFNFFGTTARPGVSRRPRPVNSNASSSGGFDLLGFLRSAFDLRVRHRRRRSRQSRQFFSTCTDRITMPCIIEDFIGTGLGPLPGCEPVHCGSQFCSSGVWPCRIESTVTPFYIGVHFGDGAGAAKGSPEENIGACLRYQQVQCI